MEAVVNADTVNPRYSDGQRLPENETDWCITSGNRTATNERCGPNNLRPFQQRPEGGAEHQIVFARRSQIILSHEAGDLRPVANLMNEYVGDQLSSRAAYRKVAGFNFVDAFPVIWRGGIRKRSHLLASEKPEGENL